MARVAAGAGIAEISGVYGPSVISNSRQGLVLRRKPVYKRPTSPDQAAASERIKQAAQAWAELDWPQVEAWNDYASRLTRTNPVNGKRYSPSGYTTFIGLATKVLQVDASAPVPLFPPVGVFMGDDILISAAPGGGFAARDERVNRGSDSEGNRGLNSEGHDSLEAQRSTSPPTPLLRRESSGLAGSAGAGEGSPEYDSPSARTPTSPPTPRLRRESLARAISVGAGEGSPEYDSPSAQRRSSSRRSPSLRAGEGAAVVFTSTGPNTPGTVTELLLQKLVNIRRAAGVQYKSVAFVSFGTEVEVPVEPGAYVPAYQFVEAATGRVTGLIVLPRIEVTGG